MAFEDHQARFKPSCQFVHFRHFLRKSVKTLTTDFDGLTALNTIKTINFRMSRARMTVARSQTMTELLGPDVIERYRERKSASHGEAGYARRPLDAYFTEPWVTRALIAAVDFQLPDWPDADSVGRAP